MKPVLNHSAKESCRAVRTWAKRYVAVLLLGVFYVIMSWLFTLLANSFWK